MACAREFPLLEEVASDPSAPLQVPDVRRLKESLGGESVHALGGQALLSRLEWVGEQRFLLKAGEIERVKVQRGAEVYPCRIVFVRRWCLRRLLVR